MPIVDQKEQSKLARKWLSTIAKPVKKWTQLTILISFVSGLFLIWQMYLLAHISYEAYIQKQTVSELSIYFIELIIIVFIRAIFSWLKEIVSYKAATSVKKKLREDIISHINKLGPIKSSQVNSASLISSSTEQVDGITNFLTKFLPQITLSGLMPLVILIFVFSQNIVCGILLMICAPLVPLFMILVGMGADSENQKHFKTLSRMSATFLDTLRGLTTLKLFNKSKGQSEKIFQASDNFRIKTMRVLKIAFLSSAVLEMFSAASIALIAIFLGMGLINAGSGNDLWWALSGMTLQSALFILLLAPEFFMPLRELSTHYHAKAEAVGAALEISKIFAMKTDEKDNLQNLDTDIKSISIKNLNVSYNGDSNTLKNINLDITNSQKIAIVGASGAGKTTLINTLLGFIDYTGNIRINNEYEISYIDEKSWLKNISWLGQNATLFKGTIRDNLLLADNNATDDKIFETLERANVAEFIKSLPNGLDTEIGEQNLGLSGGQAQRIALARAYIKQHQLLILDEPTASLDKESEDKIITSLKNSWSDKTVIMLTHKLSFLDCVDNIIVLKNGEIIEQGTFTELSQNKDSEFYSFYKNEVQI